MAFLQIINIKMNLKGSLLKKSEALYFFSLYCERKQHL